MKKLFVALLLVNVFLGCTHEAFNNPCDDLECQNNAPCINGTCLCEEGFSGETCNDLLMPEALWIESISLSGYPVFRQGDPWDGQVGAPACWPDITIAIRWPWNVYTSAFQKINAAGNPLYWGEVAFPHLDNHIHEGDSLEIAVLEMDGSDSTTVINQPEVLFEQRLLWSEIAAADSSNNWPTSLTLVSDTSDLKMTLALIYSFDH